MSRWVNGGDGRRSASRRSSQSRISLRGARSPRKSASAAWSARSERPSSRGSGGGGCASCGTNFHSVIQNPSRSCGPGGRMSLGATTRSVRSAKKAATATSRASHRSASSCKTAVPVITRATTGAGLRCTTTLLPAAIRTASSQATPCSRATACAAASDEASPVTPAIIASRHPRCATLLPMPEDHFGEDIAAHYDDPSDEMFQPGVIGPVIEFLAALAGDGAALELGIGTGRIALPLAQRGVEVHGIDLSLAMVDRLRAKPGGSDVGVTIGDFADTRVPGEFSLTYLVFNTICNLTTQEVQVACFVNAAEHLRPGGHFVIEVGVSALRLLPPGQRAVPFAVSDGHWAYDLYDCASQAMSSNYVDDHGRRSIPFRYVWPSELDLMARIAGMVLADRWEDWDRTPFTHESNRHVTVWRKAN